MDDLARAEYFERMDAPKEEFTLLDYEIKELVKLPGALRALADWHDHQESMAGAIGCGSAQHHQERRLALTGLAKQIQQKWERS
jgi:hypothetical protein